jgi:hypothetical protein
MAFSTSEYPPDQVFSHYFSGMKDLAEPAKGIIFSRWKKSCFYVYQP